MHLRWIRATPITPTGPMLEPTIERKGRRQMTRSARPRNSNNESVPICENAVVINDDSVSLQFGGATLPEFVYGITIGMTESRRLSRASSQKTHSPEKLFDNLELDSLLTEILGRLAAGACHLMEFCAA